MTRLHLDWESKSEIDLTQQGLDVYSAHESTRVMMGAWSFDDGPIQHWDYNDAARPPKELCEAIEDPHVVKWAFNAQFERVMARRVLKLKTPYKNWRCTKVLAHTQSFVGKLDQIVKQIGLPQDVEKDAEGKRLIKLFTGPQRTTKANPLRWRDRFTDEADWEWFCQYNKQDVRAERDGLYRELIKYAPPDIEWELYEIDQQTNDRGLPIDRRFVENASIMSKRRQAELTAELVEVTDLANPNSPKQLLGWLQDRGYPFDDLRKDTVKKVLAENAEKAQLKLEVMVEQGEEGDDADVFYDPQSFEGGFLSGEAVQALRLRQQAARTSVKKYDKILKLIGPGDRLRFGLQFHGAARTGRDAGRGLNPQNLSRPPAEMDVSKTALAAGVPEDSILDLITELVRAGDYEGLKLSVTEPMNALAGIVRSAIGLPEDGDEELCAADLSSIETVVIGWTSGCKRLLDVFRNKRDAYKDFGSMMYKMAYEEIVGKLRQNSKPAVLGCGFRLGGGELIDGKRTGLWGYAEAMGVNMTREEAHKAVHIFRKEAYPEVPYLWYALEDAVIKCMTEKRRVSPVVRYQGQRFVVPVVFEQLGPYLTIMLPSGRRLYYHKPRLEKRKMRLRPTAENPQGAVIEKTNLTYMGKQQNGQAWVRIATHGGKITENIVQAIAREILMAGLVRAARAGFKIVLRVHDELVAIVKKGDNYFTTERLVELLTQKLDDGLLDWTTDMPLGAAGWTAPFYRK